MIIILYSIRARCIRLFRSKHANYVNTIESKIKSNPCTFWTYVNNLKNNNELPLSTFHGNHQATTTTLRHGNNDHDISCPFSNHFSAVYSQNNVHLVS